VNVVDSSAWLEFFAGNAMASSFNAAIEDVEQLLVPTIVVTEVTRVVLRQRGEDDAMQIAAALHRGSVVSLDSGLAMSAAKLGIAHRLPLADSIIYATALHFGATLWTMDSDFEGLPGVRYFPKAG
jgi:toxin FitB